MRKFNLCEAFFSGYYFFREEFASCALGYALSPFSSGGVEPLKFFIEKLRSTQNKYGDLLDDALKTLNAGQDLSWNETFVNTPLEGNTTVAVALEFKEIDVLVRVGDVIFLIENKIINSSVGKIGKQISEYKKSLEEYWQNRTIPIAIFPDQAKNDFDDIIAISWNGKEEFTLLHFFETLAEQCPSLDDFVLMIKENFSLKSRAGLTQKDSYNVLVNKFDEGYPDIIREIFPEENVAFGDDMNAGGCLLYRLPLRKSRGECFPFRLMVNGKCEILYQGLRQPVFFQGKTFDGEHTIRDIIKAFLISKGVKFTARYHFSYKEFASSQKRTAFKEVLKLLERIDAEEWYSDENKVQFLTCYNEITGTDIPVEKLKNHLHQCLDLSDEKLLKDKKLYSELYRILSEINAEK